MKLVLIKNEFVLQRCHRRTQKWLVVVGTFQTFNEAQRCISAIKFIDSCEIKVLNITFEYRNIKLIK